MTPEKRQFYIDWLLLAYPFKAESYFRRMNDADLLKEYEKLSDIF